MAPTGGRCGVIQSASSRTKNVIGATLVGITRRLPAAVSSSVAGCGDKPSPTYGTGKAKLIEPFGIVIRNAAAQNVPFPGAGGNLESLQLPQHIEGGAFSLHLAPGATCCQRNSQRMNCAAVTGSICLRSVATVRR